MPGAYLSKGDMRRRDAEDIAGGRRTPEQVQEENSFLPGTVIREAVIHHDPKEFEAACMEFVRQIDALPRH